MQCLYDHLDIMRRGWRAAPRSADRVLDARELVVDEIDEGVKVLELLGEELGFVALEVNACCSSSDVGVDGRHGENEGVDGEEGGDGSF